VSKAKAIDRVCREHGVALATAALRYPLLAAPVVAVVAGADSEAQVRDNVARLDAPIPDALWDDLDAQGLVPRCG
jgi:D-threo-aldose 1-dehydrogenase